MCKIKRKIWESKAMLRNWKQYNFDVRKGGVTRSGIKGACVRPDVKSFKVFYYVND